MGRMALVGNMATELSLDEWGRDEWAAPAPRYPLTRDGVVRIGSIAASVAQPRRREYPGETPIMGKGAVARWVALHDRARDLRAVLRPGDGVGERQVRRAIRSLFLYEYELTPKTRRQARTFLWCRDRADRLPPFVERVGWSRCRCVCCQMGCQAGAVATNQVATPGANVREACRPEDVQGSWSSAPEWLLDLERCDIPPLR